jgi:hypothetical protein
MIGVWKIAGRCFGKQLYGRPRKKGEEFKVCVHWIELAQNRFVNAIKNLQFP